MFCQSLENSDEHAAKLTSIHILRISIEILSKSTMSDDSGHLTIYLFFI